MDVLVTLVGKVSDLSMGIGEVLVFGEVDFFRLDGTDDSFRIAILPRGAPVPLGAAC